MHRTHELIPFVGVGRSNAILRVTFRERFTLFVEGEIIGFTTVELSIQAKRRGSIRVNEKSEAREWNVPSKGEEQIEEF